MEDKLLSKLKSVFESMDFPLPLDGRGTLETNAGGKKWKKRDVGKLKGFVWHQELGWGSVESVARYHTGSDSHLSAGGVESIAYTWAVRRNGQILLCNDFDRATWSQGYKERPGDENAEFMSLMFEGLFKGEKVEDSSAGEPNDRQMLSALVLWHICRNEWSWDCDDLYGHYLFGKPACPGNTLGTMVEAIRINVEKESFNLATVKGRQEALNAMGYNLGIADGIWGAASKGALIRFQSDHDLSPDGIWGRQSAAALKKALKER